MNEACTIQLHADGAWHDLGIIGVHAHLRPGLARLADALAELH